MQKTTWKVIYKIESFGNVVIEADNREEALIAFNKIASKPKPLFNKSEVIRANTIGIILVKQGDE